MFIGREKELAILEEKYQEDSFQMFVVYGRRRVGKTRLLSEFCQNKPAIFYVAEEYSDKVALEKFSKQVAAYFGMEEYFTSFESWEKAFLFLAKKAEKESLILVLDEFPYLAGSNKSLPSLLQNLIDHHLKNSRLFLIICGSSMSFMEKEVLGYKSPLYGRRTGQILVKPLDFFTSRRFFPHYSLAESLAAYSVLGGIPHYLVQFSPEKTVAENIKKNVLSTASYLYEEPSSILKQELREPAVYNGIIEAIAKGATRLSQIADKVHESSDKCAKYIKSLQDLHIIEKESPAITKSKRKSVYRLTDNLFRFWYRFISNNVSLLEQGNIDHVYDNKIAPYLDEYLGNIFEDLCRQYLIIEGSRLNPPLYIEKVQRWWGNNPVKKREEEIDIVATGEDFLLLGECKWRNKQVGLKELAELEEKGALFPGYKKKYYALFAKIGFRPELKKYAHNKEDILLFDAKDL